MLLAHARLVPADSQPSVRPGWNNLWSFPGALLDLLWCHFDWESHREDAHPGGFLRTPSSRHVCRSLAFIMTHLPLLRVITVLWPYQKVQSK